MMISALVKRRKGQRPQDLCEGDDPISLDPFADMPPEEIIIIGEHCFHLPSLYHWVFNNGNNRNPLTNLEFENQELRALKDAAFERYPLTIRVQNLQNVDPVIQDTRLASYKKLFITVVARAMDPNVTTFWEAFQAYERSSQRLTVANDIGLPRNIFQGLTIHENDQLFTLTNDPVLVLYRSRHLTPPAAVALLDGMIEFARHKQWPFEWLEQERDGIQRHIDQATRAGLQIRRLQAEVDQRAAEIDEFYREVYPDDDQVILVNVSYRGVNIENIRMALDATLTDVGERLAGYLPDAAHLLNNFRYIYAGAAYPSNRRVNELPNAQNGIRIFIT
jgi:hypothetical protein